MILWRRRPRDPAKLGKEPLWLDVLGVDMTWQTPVAIDFRFGMEITMYVSNR